MNTTIPIVDAIVDHPTSKVKEAIISISQSVKPADANGFYKSDFNEAFGIFNFNIHYHEFSSGLVLGKMQVSVNEAEGKTKINVSSMSTTFGVLDNSKVHKVQSHFLTLLNAKLNNSHTFDSIITAKSNESSGCLGFAVIIIASIFLSILLFSCKKSNPTFSINQGYDTLNIVVGREYTFNNEKDTIVFYADGWVSERAGKSVRILKVGIRAEQSYVSATGISYVVRFAEDTQKFTGVDYGKLNFLSKLPAYFNSEESKPDTIHFVSPHFNLIPIN